MTYWVFPFDDVGFHLQSLSYTRSELNDFLNAVKPRPSNSVLLTIVTNHNLIHNVFIRVLKVELFHSIVMFNSSRGELLYILFI